MAPTRAWQRMLSGRRLDLLDPSPFDVEIEDIAHGLARVARWNGQTIGKHAYSVAQHSVLVSQLTAELSPGLSPQNRLMALLHDAPEYVIGDLISPFKAAVGLGYKTLEHKLQAVIHIRFSLPAKTPRELHTVIKRADTISAYCEATQLAGFEDQEARKIFGPPPKNLAIPHLSPLPTSEAQQLFLDFFHQLAPADK